MNNHLSFFVSLHTLKTIREAPIKLKGATAHHVKGAAIFAIAHHGFAHPKEHLKAIALVQNHIRTQLKPCTHMGEGVAGGTVPGVAHIHKGGQIQVLNIVGTEIEHNGF